MVAFLTVQFLSFTPQGGKAQIRMNFQIFYDDLSPYGAWIRHDRLGFVWSPSVNHDFFPYGTNGYWVYTESGWTWFSEFTWGWAPFHYGRWFYDDFYGWLWLPDYEWAPAWVIWRSCDGYYGWTPWEPGIDINMAFNNNYHHDHRLWRFVRNRDMGRKDIGLRFSGLGQYLNLLTQSKVIENRRTDQSNNIVYHAGPFRNEVERQTGRKLSPALIGELNTPAQKMKKDRMFIYRPQINNEALINKDASPKKITDWRKEQPQMEEIREPHHPVKQLEQENLQQFPKRTEVPKTMPPLDLPSRPVQPAGERPTEHLQQVNPKISVPRNEMPERQVPVVPQPRKEEPAIQRPVPQPRELNQPTPRREQPQIKPTAPEPRNIQPEKRILPPDNRPFKPKTQKVLP
jgi:hypothetical protein